MLQPKLPLVDKQALLDVIDSEGMRALLAEMESVVLELQGEVLKCSLLTTKDEKTLIRKRCRADGAAVLLARTKARLESLKAKQKR